MSGASSKKIPERILEKSVSEEEGPLENRGIDGKTKGGRILSNCSIGKSGGQRQDMSDWKKKTGETMVRDRPEDDRNNNNNNDVDNNNNNNNSTHSPVQ